MVVEEVITVQTVGSWDQPNTLVWTHTCSEVDVKHKDNGCRKS